MNETVRNYLFFGGRCEEAIEFYQKSLGAEVVMMMRFRESPEPLPADMLPDGFDDKIMHATLRVGGSTVMVSDGCGEVAGFQGFRLAFSVATEAAADRVFDALAEQGTVDMPLAKTFWSPRYGMVTDRFGVGWMVMVTEETASSTDEQAIRDLMAKWRSAVEAKDVVAMMEGYSHDALLFDGCPPYKTEGVENIRKVWEHCLPYFPDEFKSEHRDMKIYVDGDIAMAHGLHHFVPTPADHPCGMTWMRVTLGFRRFEDGWKVMHEHVSIPFNPMTNQSWTITDPDKLDMPDYSAGSDNGSSAS